MHLAFLPKGTVRLQGPLGNALNLTIANRLKKINYSQLVDPFRFRNESDNKWRCEFWGKILRSVILAWRSTDDSELFAIIEQTVGDLLSTQTSDGRITSYPESKQLGGWDIWGRKYILLGLLEYYREVKAAPEVRESLIRMTDDLLRQVTVIQDYGQHYGLAAGSIIRALVEVYRISGKKNHLEAVQKLAAAGCCHVHNIFDAARVGAMPSEICNGKAYEMMSCFQGLAALFEVIGDFAMRQSFVRFYESVRDHDIFITGGGGLKDANGEFWYNGALRQTRTDCGGMGETCVTVTWLQYCLVMLRMLGDSTVVDEMERSFYNALLGAMTPDGTNFTHINPLLTGNSWKRASGNQIANFPDHDCCRAQGPYGLALAPKLALMETEKGYAVHLYENMEAPGILMIKGNYPSGNSVRIRLDRDGDFELALRIPGQFACRVDGRRVPGGEYYRLRRKWKCGDEISLEFDFSERMLLSKCGGFEACMCGPLVMVDDLRPDTAPPLNSFLHSIRGRVDYASAGNLFSPENVMKTWKEKTYSYARAIPSGSFGDIFPNEIS